MIDAIHTKKDNNGSGNCVGVRCRKKKCGSSYKCERRMTRQMKAAAARTTRMKKEVSTAALSLTSAATDECHSPTSPTSTSSLSSSYLLSSVTTPPTTTTPTTATSIITKTVIMDAETLPPPSPTSISTKSQTSVTIDGHSEELYIPAALDSLLGGLISEWDPTNTKITTTTASTSTSVPWVPLQEFDFTNLLEAPIDLDYLLHLSDAPFFESDHSSVPLARTSSFCTAFSSSCDSVRAPLYTSSTQFSPCDVSWSCSSSFTTLPLSTTTITTSTTTTTTTTTTQAAQEQQQQKQMSQLKKEISPVLCTSSTLSSFFPSPTSVVSDNSSIFNTNNAVVPSLSSTVVTDTVQSSTILSEMEKDIDSYYYTTKKEEENNLYTQVKAHEQLCRVSGEEYNNVGIWTQFYPTSTYPDCRYA